MDTRDRQRRCNAFGPALISIAALLLVHFLAKNVAAALLSASLCGFPSGGKDLVDELLLARLESADRMSAAKVRDVPETASDLTLQ
ncbi:MAG TPA: hypothetical protein VKB88_08310 [Bryobacteraceae bacterium]|nr:hypothetical protein [Bryobacteraceae bacterium]